MQLYHMLHPIFTVVPLSKHSTHLVLRRLLDDDERYHPDGLETFNPTALGRPWHGRVVRFAETHGLAKLGDSDAHDLAAGLQLLWTPGPTPGACVLLATAAAAVRLKSSVSTPPPLSSIVSLPKGASAAN